MIFQFANWSVKRGYPQLDGWFHGQSDSKNGWELGVPPWQNRNPPNGGFVGNLMGKNRNFLIEIIWLIWIMSLASSGHVSTFPPKNHGFRRSFLNKRGCYEIGASWYPRFFEKPWVLRLLVIHQWHLIWSHDIPMIGWIGHENLVGGLKHFLFSISYMGCHPNPIDELHDFSRWAHCTTNQSSTSIHCYWCRNSTPDDAFQTACGDKQDIPWLANFSHYISSHRNTKVDSTSFYWLYLTCEAVTG